MWVLRGQDKEGRVGSSAGASDPSYQGPEKKPAKDQPSSAVVDLLTDSFLLHVVDICSHPNRHPISQQHNNFSHFSGTPHCHPPH